MNYKIILLAPSAGGKSTLMRYLREYNKLHVVETDEEVMKANNDVWPNDNDYKDRILLPTIADKVIKQDEILFMGSYIPSELLRKAKENSFKIVLLQVPMDELKKRNVKRISEEGYDDSSPWIEGQLENYRRLSQEGLIDNTIDGRQSTHDIAEEIIKLSKTKF
jgi:adenylate kinase family enzyme